MKRLMFAAGICAAFCAGAVPTRDALESAGPRVEKLSAGIVDKLKSGEMEPGGGADALVALADGESGEAEKMLLLNGALRLRMRSGDIAGAKSVVDKLRSDVKGLTAEQLNDMMLEESNNFFSALLVDEKSLSPDRKGKEWHVKKDRLGSNGLTVTSLDELRKCDRSKVERLYLRGAKGVTDEDLEGLTGIKALDLSETDIREIPAPVFKMRTLRWLWLARNPLKEVSKGISMLKELVYLNLDGCSDLEEISWTISRLVDSRRGGKLQYLRVNDTMVEDVCAFFPRVEFVLRRVYARGSNMHRFFMSAMSTEESSCPNLMDCIEDLDLGNTQFTFNHKWFENSECVKIGPHMKRLSFAGCRQLTKLPKVLKTDNPDYDWSKLQLLDLSNTPIARDKEELARIRREIGDTVTIIY